MPSSSPWWCSFSWTHVVQLRHNHCMALILFVYANDLCNFGMFSNYVCVPPMVPLLIKAASKPDDLTGVLQHNTCFGHSPVGSHSPSSSFIVTTVLSSSGLTRTGNGLSGLFRGLTTTVKSSRSSILRSARTVMVKFFSVSSVLNVTILLKAT